MGSQLVVLDSHVSPYMQGGVGPAVRSISAETFVFAVQVSCLPQLAHFSF